MAILQALFAALSRSLGKFLNTAFGWATILLFGKVPPERQFLLSITGFGAVAWMIAVIGIAFPNVATFLLSFVTIPDWAEMYVRIVMITAALLLPALIGFLSMTALDKEDRPKDASGKIKSILRGYPYALGLSLTLVMMCLIAPILKVRDMAKRWSSVHMPLIVKAEKYNDAVALIQRILNDRKQPTTVAAASWLVRFPTAIFTYFAKSSVNDLVAENLQTINNPKFSILVHPSDLLISGRSQDVSRIQSILSAAMFLDTAHVAWSKDGQKLEDRFNALVLRERSPSDAFNDFRQIARALESSQITFEEWEVLYRLQLQTEIHLRERSKDTRAGSFSPEEFENLSLVQKLSAGVLIAAALWKSRNDVTLQQSVALNARPHPHDHAATM